MRFDSIRFDSGFGVGKVFFVFVFVFVVFVVFIVIAGVYLLTNRILLPFASLLTSRTSLTADLI